MGYVSEEDIQMAREMDLLTYLEAYEPQELVHVSGDTYCTREHDSLKISNGKWYWFSRGIGGKTALDYLINVQNYTLPEAVEIIIGRAAVRPPVFHTPKTKAKEFSMPEANVNNASVRRYLASRGIDPEIISYCINNKLLIETKRYHNAAFVGYDSAGKPRYASLRGTYGTFKGEADGSKKRYSFSIPGEQASTVHLFEAAIDAMSFATLLKMTGRDWRRDTLLSLGGVYIPKRENEIPAALEQYLADHPQTESIVLHLDNDEVGRGAAIGIISALSEKYRVIDCPPPDGKDVNDYLMMKIENQKKKEEPER